MGERIAGICYFKVDGTQLDISGGIECPLSSTKNSSVLSTTGVAGRKEEVVAPYIKLSALFKASFPIDTITQGTSMTITAEFPNGKTYTLSSAYLVDDSTVKSEDGTIDLKFEGEEGIWS